MADGQISDYHNHRPRGRAGQYIIPLLLLSFVVVVAIVVVVVVDGRRASPGAADIDRTGAARRRPADGLIADPS